MNQEIIGSNSSRAYIDEAPVQARPDLLEPVPAYSVERLAADAYRAYPDTRKSHEGVTKLIPDSAEVQAQILLNATKLGALVVDFRELEQVKLNHPNLGR